jgi:hypothetical protein
MESIHRIYTRHRKSRLLLLLEIPKRLLSGNFTRRVDHRPRSLGALFRAHFLRNVIPVFLRKGIWRGLRRPNGGNGRHNDDGLELWPGVGEGAF